MATLHYTSGGTSSEVTPHGFNLVDVQSVAQLNALPDGVMGLVWLNEYEGVNSSFINKVTPFIGHPKLFGFFLVDEPDPTGNWGDYATAADLKAESDWIHKNVPGAKTFITMMNIGSFKSPNFKDTFNPANTGIDFYGINPYPVRTNSTDFTLIDRQVAAALDAGIPLSKIVPVYQTFGGGDYRTDTGDKYVLPSTTQMQTMVDRWSSLVPNPAFDYAYAWGSQQGSTTLESSSSLQQFFKQRNSQDVGNDILEGTAGADTLAGYGGNDTYYVNHAGDKVVEAVGGGSDKVLASVSYVLTAGSEIELLATTNAAGKGAINLTGNEFAQTIQGNAGANVINGAGGADTMIGYAGDDIYYVDNSGDKVTEALGGGSDTVLTTASYVLAAGAEIELLATTNAHGTGAIRLTGNEFAQTLYGNAGDNFLDGRGGADYLHGGSGDDVLDGGAGDDDMFGGLDDDYMYGGTGNDTMRGDEGVDRMWGGDNDDRIFGNDGNDVLLGEGGDDRLYGGIGEDDLRGGAGVDRMWGEAGNDVYFVEQGDFVYEDVGGGSDTVYASSRFTLAAGSEVEFLRAATPNSTGTLALTGNEFGQTIVGNKGVNEINGRAGNDTLTGGLGNDTFVFDTALNAATNVDTITDFSNAAGNNDGFKLDNAIFTGLALGNLALTAFKNLALGTVDGDDRIIYDQANGGLYFDQDGSGKGFTSIKFADLANNAALTHADFFVI